MFIASLVLSVALHAFLFQASFAVMGSVRGPDGRGVDSVRVSLLDDNYQTIKTVFTDHSGRFQFRGIRSGAYTVRVLPMGTPYEEASQRIDLQSLSGGRSPVRGRPATGGGAEEPYIVDLDLRRKRSAISGQTTGVVFAQTIPEPARAEYKRGMSSLKNEKSDDAIAALKRAVELFPDYYLALESLGTEYVKRGDFKAALPVLTRALEVNRNAPRSLYALGVAYLKLSRPADAAEQLQKAAQQDADNANVHMMLGLAHGYQGALAEAEVSFKKAYELGGDLAADAHLYLAGIYNKQERYGDAVRELELYLKESKDADTTKAKEMISKLKAKQKAAKK